MAKTLYIVYLFLILASTALQICPPETGIYLMLKGECIFNGTYFRDGDLQIVGGTQDGYIHCVLPNETLNGGQWLRPDGQPVDCINGVNGSLNSTDPKLKDPFFCTHDSTNANITLYLENDDYFKPTAVIDHVHLSDVIETEYKCCLPTDYSDPNTNIMTINVFERVYIIDHYVVLPSDITVIPQYYTVHCIVTGSLDEATIKQYYDENSEFVLGEHSQHTISGTELTQSYCNSQHDGYSCTVNSESITTDYTYDDTSDYTVTIEWEASVISNGPFRQSAYNGDHIHLCTAANGAIEPHDKGRNNQITVRAPSSSPSIPILVTKSLTSITINWTCPNISDVDGYIVNASSLNDYVIQQVIVNNNSVSQTTLNELLPGTTYTITVRAYQDILGPPSDEESITTLDAHPKPMVSWSRLSSITNLHDTQYGIYCVTNNIDPTLINWIVNGIKMNTTNYTLVDETDMSYNSTLLLYPNNELGQSVNVTCSIKGSEYDSYEVLLLQAPSSSINDVTAVVFSGTSLSISWTVSANNDVIKGFIVAIAPSEFINDYNSSTFQATITNLIPETKYNISVYSYKELFTVPTTQSILLPLPKVPRPVNSFLVENVSETTISVKWISSSDNYVTYYSINYEPSCPKSNISSINVSSNVNTHTLTGLYSGMNYTISLIVGNTQGQSESVTITQQTLPAEPSGTIDSNSITVHPLTDTTYYITWDEIDCFKQNGEIVGYQVSVVDTYYLNLYLTHTDKYQLTILLSRDVYNISIAVVNTVTTGSFSDAREINLYNIVGSVEEFSSALLITSGLLSWSHPSYISVNYPVILYELGYTTTDCSIVDFYNTDSVLIYVNITSSDTLQYNITNLLSKTCYLFIIRAYTNNGYGPLITITDKTMENNCNETTITAKEQSALVPVSTSLTIILLLSLIVNVSLIIAFIYSYKKSNSSNKGQIQLYEDISLSHEKTNPHHLYDECKVTISTKRHNASSVDDIEMQHCESYGLHKPPTTTTDTTTVIYE